MNEKLKLASLLLILPLFITALANIPIDVDAAKSRGTDAPGRLGTDSYGSKTASKVCGDRLCSEISSAKQPSTMTKTPAAKPKQSTQSTTEAQDEMALRLSRANVPATIPLHKGWYNGEAVYFIITDSSEQKHADIITERQGWRVELAPLLANAPKAALSTTYIFTNGIKGDGIHGFQDEVFTSTPGQPDTYSALTSHVHVTWNEGAKSKLLDSEESILAAEEEGLVTLTELPVVINMPQIMWPGGQLPVRADKTLTDETEYGGGQVLDIDTKKMSVTFVAHRGWSSDGRTVYYIVTDATPEMPATMMGVASSPTSAKLIANSAAVDLFQFGNGIKGTGPLGFQPGIAAGAPGDANYSPMWRIFMVEWKDPSSASILETMDDINAYKKAGLIDVNLARPMDSDHIVNCPFIDPFQ
ncbi:MAG: hypothetical protein WAO91_09125 [Candidatus Nitrosotenuis sp.]